MGAQSPEPALVILARDGDDAAFGELVRLRQAVVRGLLRRLCGNATLADDLAQETFVRAWRSLRQLRQPDAFGGWLRRIAVSVYLQHTRLASSAEESLDESDTLALDSAAPEIAQRLDVEHAIARLRPQERLCIVLTYAEGMSHQEVANATGLPLGTVKSHIARALKRMRQSWGTEAVKL